MSVKVMVTPPTISAIKKWLRNQNPLDLFDMEEIVVKDIDPKAWSGHFNYLVRAGRENLVLRFKGPEWGKPARGVLDEFKILKAVEKYDVGPKVFYVSRNFFGEPMTLEEYLEGKLLTDFTYKDQKRYFSGVAKFIAKINKIPVRAGAAPFKDPMLSYKVHKSEWRKRLKVILGNPSTRPWGEKIKKLLPRAEKMLNLFEPKLKRVLQKSPPAFIFVSSHVGHCLRLKNGGFRFLNWEQVSYGDPSYTLAVFLASISRRPDFPKIKDRMISAYLKINPVSDFKILVDQRLAEREVSNLLWVLWAYVKRKDKRPVEIGSSVVDRFERVKTLIML